MLRYVYCPGMCIKNGARHCVHCKLKPCKAICLTKAVNNQSLICMMLLDRMTNLLYSFDRILITLCSLICFQYSVELYIGTDDDMIISWQESENRVHYPHGNSISSPLADPGRDRRRRPLPQQDPFLLFSHTFLLKNVRIGGRLPPNGSAPPQREILDPPL